GGGLGWVRGDRAQVRKPGLELRVEAEDERKRRDGQDHAERKAESLDADPEGGAGAAAADGDREQDGRDSERVGDRHCDRLEAELVRGRRKRDEPDRGAAAGYEHEPERAAEQEPAAEIARRPAREP